MSELPGHARVVIIGGGAVGVSCLYHLAKAGWRDCLLLERNELTSGSTWHAAGNVPTFSADWSIMNLQRYGAALYRELGEIVDYPINYHVTGSVRLAHGPERMREFARARDMAAAQGMEYEMLGVGDLKERYPFLETHDLAGGLWDPLDGDIDPAQATQALARGARALGATIARFTPATGVRRESGEWVVETAKGEVRCETVVNAAGYHARRVSAWFLPFGGRLAPMTVMSHQYMLTEEIPALVEWTEASGRRLPLLRDVDASWYLRQEKAGLNLGPYERDCRGAWTTPAEPMPDDFAFQLFPDDLDRLEAHVEDAMGRVPLLAEAGVARVINGPIPYTPDGNPLIGPTPGVRGAFEACVFTFGIAQAGGAGKALAEWVTEGATEWDLWSCDPRRFTGFCDEDYCAAKGREVYGREYDMHFPREVRPAGRDRRISALHVRLLGAGAVMAPYNGWERADWFARAGDDLGAAAARTWTRAGPAEARIRDECAAVRDLAGVIAIPGFTRLRLRGPGARGWLETRAAGRAPPPGRVGLLYFCDGRGRVATETSAVAESDDDVLLITAAAAEWRDRDLLAEALPDGLALVDETEAAEAILLTGPGARGFLAPLTDADLTLPWLSAQRARVAGVEALLLRVSFAGELGWEVHVAPDGAPAVWDALAAAGARPFGMHALDALRIEKGYRSWRGDLSSDYSLLECGLERFVDWSKPAFVGRAALIAERARGPARRFVSLRVDAGPCDAHAMAPLYAGDAIVGEATSGAWGYRVGASVALGMLRSDLAVDGAPVEIGIFGERRPATVSLAPLWDPANERMRA